uniref:Uncharacterized protein n=1 Tax=Caudovirales sp. ctu3532 TaxID=2827639 RepID=A0A8S5TJL8_9CAUD|nr:MAG TPA: hypothetical protein [Caudovirales sp. ctu3532]
MRGGNSGGDKKAKAEKVRLIFFGMYKIIALEISREISNERKWKL